MTVIEHCPTCGASVRVVSGYEGTNHYEPLSTGTTEALAKEVAPMAEQLRGAVKRAETAEKEVERLKRLLAATEAELRYAAGVDETDPLGGQQ